MRIAGVLLVSTLVFTGCVHVNENSSTANVDQIRAHLVGPLHCQTLELRPVARDRFEGEGLNDQGPFHLEVAREGQTIRFKGVYSEPARGTFSGSTSWSRKVKALFGFHKTTDNSQLSLGTP